MQDLTREEDKVKPLIYKLTFDSVMGLFAIFALAIIDSIFLGMYNEKDLTASLFSNPFIFITLAFFNGIATSKTIFLSKRYKEHREDLAYYSLYIDRLFFSFAFIILSLCFFFIKDIFLLTNISETLIDKAVIYSQIHYVGIIFCLISVCLGSLLKSKGNTKIFSRSLIISAVSNILLDPLFIFYFDMGAEGAALATSLSWVISGLFVAYYTYFKFNLPFAIKKVNLSHFFKTLPNTILTQLLNTITILVTVIFTSYFTESVISGYGVASRVEKIVIIVGYALGTTMLIFLGQNKNNEKRQQEGIKHAMKINFYFMILFTFLFIFSSQYFILPFNLQGESLEAATNYLEVISYSLFFQGLYLIYISYLSVMEKNKIVFYNNIFKAFFLLPLCCYIGIHYFGYIGIFYGLVVQHFLALLFIALLTKEEFKFILNKESRNI